MMSSIEKIIRESFEEILEDDNYRDILKREELMAMQEKLNNVYETGNEFLIGWTDTEIKRYSEFDKDDLVKIVVCARLNYLPEVLQDIAKKQEGGENL